MNVINHAQIMSCVSILLPKRSFTTRGVTFTINVLLLLMVDAADCLFNGGRVGLFVLSFGGWDEGEAKFVAAPGRFTLIFQYVLWLI